LISHLTSFSKFSFNFANIGFSVGKLNCSILLTAVTLAAVQVKNTSSAKNNSDLSTSLSSTSYHKYLANFITVSLVIHSKIS
jgi:hypothetical protein